MLLPGFGFGTRTLGGFLRPSGEFHGVVITSAAEPELVTPPGLCLLNLEHYTCAASAGMFVPRRECATDFTSDCAAVRLRFGPTPSWQLETLVEYRIRDARTIDVTYTFRFERPYRAFEAFVASYFPAAMPPPWVSVDGGWQRPVIQPREQLFVARDAAAAAAVGDGRWRELVERGYEVGLQRGYYDVACLVSGSRAGGAHLLLMAPPALCPQLSPNVFAPAHDLSLVGQDVRPGDEIHVPVRLAWRDLANPQAALVHYQQFMDEVRGGLCNGNN